MNKSSTAIGLVLAFMAGGVMIWGLHALQGQQTQSAAAINADKDAELPVPVLADDPTWGAPQAPVTIVVFSDYQCPFCSKLENTLHQVKKTYGPEKVRIVWKQFPLQFHEHARPAAMASATVYGLGGNKAFWPFHDRAFSHQGSLNRESFIRWAKQVGIDEARFKAALDSNKFAPKIEKDIALGRKLGIHGTPHSIVNGIRLGGSQPLSAFRRVIDKELKEASALQATGVKQAQVYAQLLKRNWKHDTDGHKRSIQPVKKPEDTTVWRVPVGDSPVLGPKDAPITIVVFSDFQCPFCKRVGPTLARVRQAYPGKVRIVWKDRPLSFHPRAEPCAELARAARALKGDEGFWKAHDLLFASNPKLSNDDLQTIAEKLGIPWRKVKESIDEHEYADGIDADVQLAERLRANGTPHMFINGRRLVGAVSFGKFKALIDQQLSKTNNLEALGTPASEIYAKLMAKAKQPPPPPPPPRKDMPAPTKDNPWKGASRGKVVLQLISDFQCPFCRQVEPTIQRLLKKHPRELKVVWINNPLPFHKHAMLAAEAAKEVFAQKGRKGFWAYHDMLFENQRSAGGLEREALEAYAKRLGCNMPRFRAALTQHTHRKAVEQEQELAAKAGIRGTPGIVINGYFINGAMSMPVFEKTIRLAKRDLYKRQ